MFSLNREAGTTLILVTHDESLARRCGRVLQMQAGRLNEAERTGSTTLEGGGKPGMTRGG